MSEHPGLGAKLRSQVEELFMLRDLLGRVFVVGGGWRPQWPGRPEILTLEVSGCDVMIRLVGTKEESDDG